MSAATWSSCEVCKAIIKAPWKVIVRDLEAPLGWRDMVLCKKHGEKAKQVPQSERTLKAVQQAAKEKS